MQYESAIKWASPLIAHLNKNPYHRIIKFISPKLIVRVTNKYYKNRNKNAEFIITAGRPNYRERLVIKSYLKAGIKFPISKPVLFK